ncbi:MAG TPA: LppX_LprAFG lipoprotein [Solirubrobacterales bacterium]|nr:LppX_LprAFG lipoprotein [Solirubrobacterales bacterium]
MVAAIVVFAVAQGGGGGGGPLGAIAKAAEVTQREPGGRATLTSTITSSAMPEALTEHGSMIFDSTGRARGAMTVKVPGTEGEGHEAQVTTIVVGTKSYTAPESEGARVPDGKKWIGIDLADANKEVESSSPGEDSPQEGLKVLEKVRDAKEIGREEIRGVPTTRYRGTLPTATEVFGAKAHFSAPEVEVWIDARDRVRRMHLVISGSLGESKESTTTAMTIEFVSFGQVPKIEAPDPSEVFDATHQVEAQVQSAAEGN